MPDHPVTMALQDLVVVLINMLISWLLHKRHMHCHHPRAHRRVRLRRHLTVDSGEE